MILKWTGLSGGILYARNDFAFASSISSSPTTETLTLIASPAATLASIRDCFSFVSRSITASSLSSGMSSGLIVAINHLRFQQERRRRSPLLQCALFQLG